jgi:hypothetical protein
MAENKDKKLSEPQRGSLIYSTNTPKYNCGVQRFLKPPQPILYFYVRKKRTECSFLISDSIYKIKLINLLPNNKLIHNSTMFYNKLRNIT